MNKIFFTLIFIAIFTSCFYQQQGLNNLSTDSSFYPFIFTDIKAELSDITYKITGYTKSIPPRYIKKIDKYIYKVDFTISVQDEVTWDKPFLIKIHFSDDTSEDILFNGEGKVLTNAKLHEYSFSLKVNTQQRIILSLGYLDDLGETVFNFKNPFKTKSIELY